MGKIVVLVRDGCEKCIWVLKTLLAAIANVGRVVFFFLNFLFCFIHLSHFSFQDRWAGESEHHI